MIPNTEANAGLLALARRLMAHGMALENAKRFRPYLMTTTALPSIAKYNTRIAMINRGKMWVFLQGGLSVVRPDLVKQNVGQVPPQDQQVQAA